MKKAKIYITVLLALLYCSRIFAAEELVFKYSCKTSSEKGRWSAVTIKKPDPLVKGRYIIRENGKGSYTGFKDRVSWAAYVIYEEREGRIIPIEAARDVFTGGKPICMEKQYFDHKAGTVICYSQSDEPARNYKKILSYDRNNDIINRLTLNLYIQKFLQQKEKSRLVYILSNEPRLYKVMLRLAGNDTIDINGKKEKAYKIYMDVDKGFLGVFSFLIPKSYAWHSDKPDYGWLKYKGVEDNIGSPVVEIEAEE